MSKELKFQISKNDIIKKLTNLRNELARKMGIETYKVLQNATIFEIAEKMPQNDEELLQIKGIGEKKLSRFGDLILKEIHGEVVSEKEVDVENELFSVSEFLDFVNDILIKASESFKIIGEISGINVHTSGTYFSLKDKKDESILNCWMPPHFYQMMGIELEDGMEIKVDGYPNIHKPKGRFSMVVQSFELAGEGSLKKAYEVLKKKLEKEGLFERKRELSNNISNIGLITSRSGAAIDDFRQNLIVRGFNIKFHDVRVEGAKAVPEILKAVKYLNDIDQSLDVLVITRGGGSLEDLQAFNNEQVAREIFASKIPTICAIGHERDVPIANLVGDVSVSTPTAAAVAINKSWQRLEEYVQEASQKIIYSFNEKIYLENNKINSLTQKLISQYDAIFAKIKTIKEFIAREFIELEGKYREYFENINNSKDRIIKIFESKISRYSEKINIWGKYLVSNSPERNLRLGYSITHDESGKVVKSVKKLKVGNDLDISVYDGDVKSKIKKITKK